VNEGARFFPVVEVCFSVLAQTTVHTAFETVDSCVRMLLIASTVLMYFLLLY